jgi:hypothetical protein
MRWRNRPPKASPSKNENILKSVTIDGTLCKRLNRYDYLACGSNIATNPPNAATYHLMNLKC